MKNKRKRGASWTVSETFHKAVLALWSDKKNRVHAVHRGHQHSSDPKDPMMENILNNGGISKLWSKDDTFEEIYKVWDNMVCTYNVCPHTPYQSAGFNYDTYGELTTAEKHTNWQLKIHHIMSAIQ